MAAEPSQRDAAAASMDIRQVIAFSPPRAVSLQPINEQHDPSETSSASSRLLHVKTEAQSGRYGTKNKPRTTRWSRLVSNTWWFELLAITFSSSCLVAIAVILRVYQEKPLLPMAYGLTLNAIISVLATVSKAALIAAISGSLGQLKWERFRTQRKLYDLQAFDDASRGPAGSIGLLLERPGDVLAIIAAVITVLAVVFDPFIQQIVRYPSRITLSPNGVATTSRAFGFGADIDELDQISASNAGSWSDSTQFQRSPICTSGTCDWPTFTSLEWCSKCEDVTNSTVLKGDFCDNGGSYLGTSGNCTVSIAGSQPYMVVNYTVLDPSATSLDMFNNFVSPVFQMGRQYKEAWRAYDQVVPLPWAPNRTINGVRDPVVAFEYASLAYSSNFVSSLNTTIALAERCILTPCLKEIKLSMTNGVPLINTTSVNYGFTSVRGLQNFGGVSGVSSCWQPSPQNVTYSRKGKTAVDYFVLPNLYDNFFYVDKLAPAFCPISLYGFLVQQHLGGRTTTRTGATEYCTNTFPPDYSSDAMRVIRNHNLSYVLENIAASFSKLAIDKGGETVTGTVKVSETYILVRWEWMILPISLVAVGALLLLATIIRHSRHRNNLWRSSLLPLLYHQVEMSTQSSGTPPADVAGMETLARKDKATLPGHTGATEKS